jgi:hypothetical protein
MNYNQETKRKIVVRRRSRIVASNKHEKITIVKIQGRELLEEEGFNWN